jgi:hypothetical protein
MHSPLSGQPSCAQQINGALEKVSGPQGTLSMMSVPVGISMHQHQLWWKLQCTMSPEGLPPEPLLVLLLLPPPSGRTHAPFSQIRSPLQSRSFLQPPEDETPDPPHAAATIRVPSEKQAAKRK